jgi:hypothetical protein
MTGMKKVFALLVFLTLSTFAFGQQDQAAMTGVVTDASGAVVPGATVTLVNPATGTKYVEKTNATGSYRFASVPPGPGYRMTVTDKGFSIYTAENLSLLVANTRTQNAQLQAGSNIEVRVDAGSQGVTINTTDATVGNNLTIDTLNDLPVYDRTTGITTLFNLQPGESNGATTGARTDQNNVTLDGLDVNDIGFGDTFTIVAGAPVDSVQEFRGTVAGFSAGSGAGGGGQFQLVTKSGTNHFHGNINEYHRDTDLTANDYFSNLSGVPRSPLIRNQFGGNIGGPILKDKLFFFFNFNDSRIIQNNLQDRTVPLAAFAAGNVGYINSGPGCNDGSRANTQANCITYLTPAQVATLDPSGIGDSAYVHQLTNNRYPAPNDLTGGDGINTGGFRFNAPADDFQTGYVARVDYVINSKMSLYGRGTVTRENSVYAYNEFPSDPSTFPHVDRSYAYVVGHVWQISPTKTNQLIYGETKENFSNPDLYDPQGVYNPIFFSGTTQLLSAPYGTPSSSARIIPIPLITDNYTWQKGKHTIALGATFKWIHTHNSTGSDYNNVYVGLGGQTQSLNAQLRPADLFPTVTGTSSVDYDEAFTSQLGRVGNIEGAFNFDANGNVLQQGTGSKRQYRYYQNELYVSDSWKVNPQLTVSYGLDYQLFSVPYEINGEESVPNTTFDKYIQARVAQSNAGITTPTGVPFISYELGGKANSGPSLYQPQHDNFAPRVGFSYNPSWNQKTVFNGSAGLVYDRTIINALLNEQDQYSYLFQQPTAVPFGISTAPVASVTNCTSNNASTCQASGNSPRLDPTKGAALTQYNTAPPSSTAPYTPFVVGGIPGGLANGGEFNISVDPSLKTPYSIMTTFGVQHEFRGGFVAKANYVGRYGRRLLAQADANQLIDFIDPASGEGLGTAFGNITKALRAGGNSANLPAQPWFENQLPAGIGVANGYPNNTSFLADAINSLVLKGDFADSVQALSSAGLIGYNVGMGSQFSENTFFTNKGFSTYQGLLTTLTKNLSHGLQFDINYTYAHSIDNVSQIANSEAFTGYGFVCDVLRPRECRGESDFDIKHTVTADFNYDLPVGRGKQFASNIPWYLNEVIGGWSVSGITTAHSGQAFSTVSSAFVASYSNDAQAILVGPKSALARNVHKINGQLNLFANPAAAAAAFTGPVGFQIGSRNNLRGPKYFDQDLGLGKLFPIIPSKDVNLKFRADAFNAFNHASFNSPGTLTNYDDVTQTGNFGQLTSTAAGNTGNGFRVLQVSARLEF